MNTVAIQNHHFLTSTVQGTIVSLSPDRLGRILFGRLGLVSAPPVENLSYKRYDVFAEGALFTLFIFLHAR